MFAIVCCSIFFVLMHVSLTCACADIHHTCSFLKLVTILYGTSAVLSSPNFTIYLKGKEFADLFHPYLKRQ